MSSCLNRSSRGLTSLLSQLSQRRNKLSRNLAVNIPQSSWGFEKLGENSATTLPHQNERSEEKTVLDFFWIEGRACQRPGSPKYTQNSVTKICSLFIISIDFVKSTWIKIPIHSESLTWQNSPALQMNLMKVPLHRDDS